MDRENNTHADSPTVRNSRRSTFTFLSHPKHLTNTIQLREWRQRLNSHLAEANYLHRSFHSSELKHAQSVIADFAATAICEIPAYVTDTFVLKVVPEPPVWFTELPSYVQSIKLEEGRAMYSIWTEAVAWLNHAPSEVVGPITRSTSASSSVDMSSVLDAIGAAMSTLEILGMDDFPMTRATTTGKDGTLMSTEVVSTVTSTETAIDDRGPTTVANVAGKERFGVAGAVMAGVAVAAGILL
jgi:hypothetical protein